MSRQRGSLVLNPEDEFEALVMAMVQTHREKSVSYGAADDSLQNFYDISTVMGIAPLDAAETLKSKHEARLMKWRRDGRPEKDPGVDDAYKDIAVYAMIAWTLYLRGEW
jgi:hypothetical protein